VREPEGEKFCRINRRGSQFKEDDEEGGRSVRNVNTGLGVALICSGGIHKSHQPERKRGSLDPTVIVGREETYRRKGGEGKGVTRNSQEKKVYYECINGFGLGIKGKKLGRRKKGGESSILASSPCLRGAGSRSPTKKGNLRKY